MGERAIQKRNRSLSKQNSLHVLDFGLVNIEVDTPVESYGWCTSKTCCSYNVGYLADGLCEKCWDKVAYKSYQQYGKKS